MTHEDTQDPDLEKKRRLRRQMWLVYAFIVVFVASFLYVQWEIAADPHVIWPRVVWFLLQAWTVVFVAIGVVKAIIKALKT
ncbi:MAG: hypothetical protein ACHQAZ_03915 [Gammaproteobacteria bacterium]